MQADEQHKALVTGANGFIGSHLVSRLVANGWEVHVISRQGSRAAPGTEGSPVINHEHDGSTRSMIQIVAAAGPDTVFHLASLFRAEHKASDIKPMVESNLLFSTQLLEAMMENDVHKLVNTGTSWQHFEGKDYDPVCLYAAMKQAFQDIIVYYLEVSPLKAVTLKLFDTYGPGDRRAKLFSLLRRAARERLPLAMSAGEQLLDMVYIDDAANAFVMAADRLASGQTRKYEEFAVSSQQPVKLKDLVRLYGRVIGVDLPVQWGGRPYRKREVMIPWREGRALPGWYPQVGLEEGIRKMEDCA